MFYSYAYPVPEKMKTWPVEPAEARFDTSLGEFLLPYAVVRTADDPEAKLMAFLQSTYEAAANAASWSRQDLECEIGQPKVPRAIYAPQPTDDPKPSSSREGSEA
jgi:hypothetical protein